MMMDEETKENYDLTAVLRKAASEPRPSLLRERGEGSEPGPSSLGRARSPSPKAQNKQQANEDTEIMLRELTAENYDLRAVFRKAAFDNDTLRHKARLNDESKLESSNKRKQQAPSNKRRATSVNHVTNES